MDNFLGSIRQELRTFKNHLDNDIEKFNFKLNLTRQNVNDYINKQINALEKIKKDVNDHFDYLQEENTKTCKDNQNEFDKLCLSINKNDHDQYTVKKLFDDFKKTFPMRPTMLKSIPEYHLTDIQFDDFIIKQNSSTTPITDNNNNHTTYSSPINQPLLFENNDDSFIPIDQNTDDNTQISSLTTTSIGSSYRRELASQNNHHEIEPESRLVSACTTISEENPMLNMLFKINYDPNRTPHLICCNTDENYFLVYTIRSGQLEYIDIKNRQIHSINSSIEHQLLNLSYSDTYHLFYCSFRQSNRITFFRFNQQNKQTEIEREIKLHDDIGHLINVHIYENFIFYLYLSNSSIVMFEKYDVENSSIVLSINFKNKLYDQDEKSPYKIIDFTVNDLHMCFLIQLPHKAKVIVCDSETVTELHSFDLIDAKRPVSIISTQKQQSTSMTTTMSNDDIGLILYINDPEVRLIHCCTYQQYLIPAQVSTFGICSAIDGNLVLISRKDIRILDVQKYLKMVE